MNEIEIKLQEAVALAVAAHKGQFRKEAINGVALPYIVHPMQVLKMVWEWGIVDINVLAAAVCHDVKEDSNFSWPMIGSSIGSTAADLVMHLSFLPPEGITNEERAKLKAEYIARFAIAPVGALVIKLADRIANIQDWMLANIDYARKYHKKAEALFAAVCNRYEEIKQAFGEDTALKIIAAAMDYIEK